MFEKELLLQRRKAKYGQSDTDWLFVYFLFSLAKLNLPTFPQFKSFANCSGQFTMILNYSVQTC